MLTTPNFNLIVKLDKIRRVMSFSNTQLKILFNNRLISVEKLCWIELGRL